MPINTLQNWLAEFNHWVPEKAEDSGLAATGEVRPRNFKIHVLNDTLKNLEQRSKVVYYLLYLNALQIKSWNHMSLKLCFCSRLLLSGERRGEFS